ncbi:unnamed protein product [Discula destructiva]
MLPSSTPARRIFPITDWAPAHEALYPEADNDSSIDTLPFPTGKPGESSATATATATATAIASVSPALAPPLARQNTTDKRRSMSVPWRPKSVVIPVVRPIDDLDDRFGDLSLRRSQTAADGPTDSVSAILPAFGNWSGFGGEHDAHAQEISSSSSSSSSSTSSTTCCPAGPHLVDTLYSGKGKGKKSISGMWRRASGQLKTLVSRRISIATDTVGEHDQDHHQKKQLRSGHASSRSHHILNTQSILSSSSPRSPPAAAASAASSSSPSSVSSAMSPHTGRAQQHTSPRPSTSHAINARWSRLRKATSTSFRHSRILHGDFALPSSAHERSHSRISTDDLAQSVARPGLGNEPPVIPRNSGSSARAAAAAALQHDIFFTPFKNKRLTLDLAQNDQESGIGIAVTSSDSFADGLEDVGIASSVDGSLVLGACGPSRVDFIGRLPVELAIQVLAHLDAAGLASASRVSKVWHEVSSLQHIWRESYLRENTGTYATSEPIQPGTGLGVPSVLPSIDWKHAYAATEELAKRWKQGKATSVWMNGHSDSIYCLQFDEQKIITGSRDKTIRIWDMHSKECKLIIGPPEVVKDRALLYTAEGQPTHTTSFEPHTGANQRRTTAVPTTVAFQTHHKASILCLQYDEDILVTGSSDGTCIVYDMKNGYRPIRRLEHHTAAVLDLCFDDKHIVTCSKDISICVWDRTTGAFLKQLRGHSGPVNAVQMRGNTIVSCSGDFRVKLWNIETGKQIREFTGHTKGLACSQFSEDGRYVASAGNDKVIRIWDANTGECLREMKAHDSLVRSLHIDSVSGRLISGSYDTDIKVFDMETGRQMLDFPRWHSSWVLSAKSDYRRIVSTGQDPKILVIDFGEGVQGIELLESPAGARTVLEGVTDDDDDDDDDDDSVDVADGGFL